MGRERTPRSPRRSRDSRGDSRGDRDSRGNSRSRSSRERDRSPREKKVAAAAALISAAVEPDATPKPLPPPPTIPVTSFQAPTLSQPLQPTGQGIGEAHEQAQRLEIENVIIYQEKQDDTDDAEVDVKIFVLFNQSIEVKKAKNALDGRFFGGR